MVNAQTQRYAWQELSNPLPANEKGSTLEYYHRPRFEMISLFRHDPRRTLDVGCGSGATSKEVKLRFPAAHTIGVELNADAAASARERVDQLIHDNVETMDFEAHGIAKDSIDTVFFPDVLEHLRDPWALVRRLRPYLSADAQVISSIPNIRNMWLLTELVKGNWTYEPEGLLDVTHIRFFTLRGMRRLFEENGYDIVHVAHLLDGRTANQLASQPGQVVNVNTPVLTLKAMDYDDIVQLKTMQFLLVATPRPI